MMNRDYLKSRWSIFIFMLSTSIYAQTNNTFFLGHSLINFDIPNMVDKLSIASNQAFSYDANIGNGATLDWHWNNPTTGQGDQWDLTLPEGGYENFILTEAVPLENHLQYSNTYSIADSLCTFANQYNANIQYYIYETWHCTNSGNGSTSGSGGYPCSWDPNSNTLWRDRIDIDLSRWESIAEHINLNHTNPMLVIPGGQALGRLDDSIQNGAVPGLTSVFDLFVDEYHLDARGNYFIACVMYSVIHGISPVGLPNQLTNQYGNLYETYPTIQLAAVMQEIAWNTVCDYQKDGINCETVTHSFDIQEKSEIKIYPVPVYDFLTIEYSGASEHLPFTIYDHQGGIVKRSMLKSKTSTIDVEELPSGPYFISIKNHTSKFLKQGF